MGSSQRSEFPATDQSIACATPTAETIACEVGSKGENENAPESPSLAQMTLELNPPQRLIDLLGELERKGLKGQAFLDELHLSGGPFLNRLAANRLRFHRARFYFEPTDVAQQTSMVLMTRFNEIEAKYEPSRGPFARFLHRCISREMDSIIRTAGKKANREKPFGDRDIDVVDRHEPTAPADLGRIVEAINDLPGRERMLATLLYLEELSRPEAMRRVRLQKSQYHSCVKSMRRHLLERLGLPPEGD